MSRTFHAHYNINVLGSSLTMQETAKRFGPEGGSIISISVIYPIPCRLHSGPEVALTIT